MKLPSLSSGIVRNGIRSRWRADIFPAAKPRGGRREVEAGYVDCVERANACNDCCLRKKDECEESHVFDLRQCPSG